MRKPPRFSPLCTPLHSSLNDRKYLAEGDQAKVSGCHQRQRQEHHFIHMSFFRTSFIRRARERNLWHHSFTNSLTFFKKENIIWYFAHNLALLLWLFKYIFNILFYSIVYIWVDNPMIRVWEFLLIMWWRFVRTRNGQNGKTKTRSKIAGKYILLYLF